MDCPSARDNLNLRKLLKYKINFVLSKEAVEPSYSKLEKYISNEIAPNIKEDGKKIIILALLDIIRKDKSLEQENRELFEFYFGFYKEDFLQESKFEFLEIVSNALRYTTYGNVKNKYEGDMAPVINEDYINAVTSPYLNDVDWDIENQTLTLTYLNLYNTFCKDFHKYKMDYFLREIDPNREINGDWISECDDYFDYVCNSDKYRKDNYRESFIWDKINLFINKFDEYVKYLCIHSTPIITSEKIYIPYDGKTEGKIKPIIVEEQHECYELKTFSSEKNAYPSPLIKHKFYSNTQRMREELSDIYNEMGQYVFPHLQ